MQAMMLLVAQGQTWKPYQVQAPLRPQRPRVTASIRHQGPTAPAAVLAATAASSRRPRCSRAAIDDDELGYGREDIGPGGEDPEGRYTWERCGVWLWINGVDCFDVVVVISLAKLWDRMEVVVTAPIDEDVTKKDIFADWSLRKATLKIKGEALFDGIPGCELDVDECFWEMGEDAQGAPRRGREAAPAQDADTAMATEDAQMGPSEQLMEEDEDVAFEALLEKRVHQEYDKDFGDDFDDDDV
eukprot:s97_g34.t2